MNADITQWCLETPSEIPSSNEVHVWRVFVKANNFRVEKLAGLLSAGEIERAAKFYFAPDQRRFIIARGILRVILGHSLRKEPQSLRFKYTAHGKPLLATNDDDDCLSFNLSHSGGIALYASRLLVRVFHVNWNSGVSRQ